MAKRGRKPKRVEDMTGAEKLKLPRYRGLKPWKSGEQPKGGRPREHREPWLDRPGCSSRHQVIDFRIPANLGNRVECAVSPTHHARLSGIRGRGRKRRADGLHPYLCGEHAGRKAIVGICEGSDRKERQ